MTTKTGLRVASLLSFLTSLSLAACGSPGGPGDTGSGGTSGGAGTTGNGGSATGGTTGLAGSSGTGRGGSSAGTTGPGTGGSSAGTTGPGSGGSSAGTTGPGTGGSNPGTAGTVAPAGSGGSGGSGGSTAGAGGRGGSGTAGAGGRGGSTTGTGGTAGSGAAGTGGSGSGTPSGENSGATCNATSAPLLAAQNKKLPNPFAMHDGTVISTKAQWECRRNEIKADLEKFEVGPKQAPETATVAATLSGKTLTVKVTTSSGSLTLTSTVSGSGSCVAIGMNGPSSIISGCTQVPFMHDNVIAYAGGTGSQNQNDPFYKVYPSLWGKIGNYSAWSWGISRLIDGIIQVKDQLMIDPTKIGVQGCSYAGKMALFGGALDERVALTVAEESGGGGITSWRTSQDFTTRTGVSVEKIDNTNYAWFMSSMKSLDPYKLPHDHHELIAMVAPRAIIALGNPGYDWLGDESGYKSVIAATEVFKAMGIPSNIGYDFTGGHSHCGPPATQTASVKTFVDRFLKGGTGSTNVAIKPSATNFNLDTAGVIDWTTPTLQ